MPLFAVFVGTVLLRLRGINAVQSDAFASNFKGIAVNYLRLSGELNSLTWRRQQYLEHGEDQRVHVNYATD